MGHGLGGVAKFIENPFHLIPSGIESIIQRIAPIALTALGQPELAAAYSGINTVANGGSVGSGLLNAGLSYGGSKLGSALGGGGAGTGTSSVGGAISGGAGGGSSFFGDIGDGIGSIGKKIGDFTGISDLAGGINSGLNDVGSFFNDTAKSIGDSTGLSDVYNSASSGINGLGSSLKSAANDVGNYIGVGNNLDGFGNAIPRGNAGDLLSGAAQPTNGSGLLGDLGLVGRGISSLNNSIGGSTTGGNVGTTNLGGTLATLAGGLGQGVLIDQAKKDQLKQIAAQQANLGTFDPSGITSDPGYQFQYDQGLQGLQRQLAAGGGTQSGAALKAAQQYGQNYANNAFNDYYNRWANQIGAQNQLLANKGNVQSSSLLGQGQNLSQTLTNAFNPQAGFSLADLLKQKVTL